MPGVTITFHLENVDGTNNVGKVVATLSNYGNTPPVVAGTANLVTTTVTALTAADGTGSFSLFGNYQISPANTFWTIQTHAVGGILPATTAKYQLNAGGTFDLSSLTPIDATPLPPAGINTVLQSLALGGTGADLSATGGANKFVKQISAGAPLSVSTITNADIATPVASLAVVKAPTGPQSITGQTTAFVSALVTLDSSSPLTLSGALNLAGSGGANQFVKQSSASGPVSVAAITTADISSVGIVQTPTANQTINGSQTLTTAGDVYFNSGRPWFDVRAFGATGNGSTNDSTNIQAAITAAAAVGGMVFFPPGTYKCNITVPNGVTLFGTGFGWMAPGLTPIPTTLKSASGTGATAVVTVTLSGGGSEASRIQGLLIQGNNTGSGDVGLLIPNATGNGTVEVIDTAFASFGQQAVLQNGPGGHLIMNMVLVEGALSDKTSAIRRGAIEIHASNAQLNNVEVGAGIVNGATITNAALNNCALLVDGTYGIYIGVVAEMAELGIYLTSAASGNTFIGCNANLNAGHGWFVNDAGNNTFSNCLASNNGQATASTYDGFNLSAASGPNMFSNTLCIINGGFLAGRYGINDASTALPGNSYSNVRTAGSFTAPTNFGGAGGTSVINVPHRISFDKGDASVTVVCLTDPETTLYNSPLTANRTVTLSTTGAWNGAKFRTVRTAASTGASTLTVGSKALAAGQWVEHTFASGAWFETAFGSL